MAQNGLVILELPLLAFVLIIFVTRRSKPLSAAVGILAIGIAAIEEVFIVLPAALQGGTGALDLNWLRLLPGAVSLEPGHESFLRVGIGVDPLAAIMLVVVTVVSLLVQVYSRSYMIEHGDYDPG